MEEREVTKEEFKELYFKYGGQGTGWTADYWNSFYENLEGTRFLFREPETVNHNRLFIASDKKDLRMFLATEEAEERFFEFPEKD